MTVSAAVVETGVQETMEEVPKAGSDLELVPNSQ